MGSNNRAGADAWEAYTSEASFSWNINNLESNNLSSIYKRGIFKGTKLQDLLSVANMILEQCPFKLKGLVSTMDSSAMPCSKESALVKCKINLQKDFLNGKVESEAESSWLEWPSHFLYSLVKWWCDSIVQHVHFGSKQTIIPLTFYMACLEPVWNQ